MKGRRENVHRHLLETDEVIERGLMNYFAERREVIIAMKHLHYSVCLSKRTLLTTASGRSRTFTNQQRGRILGGQIAEFTMCAFPRFLQQFTKRNEACSVPCVYPVATVNAETSLEARRTGDELPVT